MSTLVCAELGSNHNGSLSTCKRLIEAAKEAGADAAKLQLFRAEWLCHPKHPAYETVKANELPREWMPRLMEFASEVGIQLSATPCDLEAVELLDSLDVPWIKIASGDITYLPLIECAAKTGRPLIISTGAATLVEVCAAARTAIDAGSDDVTLLQCSITYPAKAENSHLLTMAGMKYLTGTVGFSDHSLSMTLPAVAVGLGATVIEKHFTLSRHQSGPDHPHSLEPEEFEAMVWAIREAEEALGDGVKQPLPEEADMRIWARRGNYNGSWLRPTREAGLE